MRGRGRVMWRGKKGGRMGGKWKGRCGGRRNRGKGKEEKERGVSRDGRRSRSKGRGRD